MSTQTTTISVRLPVSVKKDLVELSELSGRSQSSLAAFAISSYVAHDLDICRKIKEGMDSVARGEVYTHEEVMERAQAVIDGYAKRQVG
jgi:predicted transcriptional regulator